MSDRGNPRTPPDFGIPDLEVPPARPSHAELRASRPAVPRTSAMPPAGLGRELEDDTFDTGGIELDRDGTITPAGVPTEFGRSGLGEDDFAPPAVSGLRTRAPGLGDLVEVDRPWPTGKTPERSRMLFDAAEIARLAAYGAPPRVGVLTPFYAARVFLRRRALIARLRVLDDELTRAEAERDALLADMVAPLQPTLERHPLFARYFPLRDGESLADLGRRVLASPGVVQPEPSLLDGVSRADERVRSLATQCELHLRALDACDEARVRQGYAWTAVLVVLGIGLLLWPAIG